jgi:hypothetical protein
MAKNQKAGENRKMNDVVPGIRNQEDYFLGPSNTFNFFFDSLEWARRVVSALRTKLPTSLERPMAVLLV